jgi:bifunctional non-homologous end joining protein LigD
MRSSVSSKRTEIEVEGRHLSLSNLDKVLFPKVGFTKGALIDYYVRVAPVMLPHIANRAVTFRRYPDGVESQSFFEKHAPSHTPQWVATTRVELESASGRTGKRAGEIEYAVINDLPSLVWAANLATIEFHVPLWRVTPGKRAPTTTDYLVFDLDPGPGVSIVECCRVAPWLREALDANGLSNCHPKTSGSKGMQLYARLPDGTSWEAARDKSFDLARSVERDHSNLVVTNMRKELRKNRVLIDWSQNHRAKTTVAAYSVRARDEPTVSTPVTWDEVAECAKAGDGDLLRFTTREVLERVAERGDLFADLVAI